MQNLCLYAVGVALKCKVEKIVKRKTYKKTAVAASTAGATADAPSTTDVVTDTGHGYCSYGRSSYS